MSIIEQAVRRLEELKRSGIEPPAGAQAVGPAAARTGGQAVASAPVVARTMPEPKAVAPEPKSRLVNIDLERLSAMDYLTPASQRSRIADEFRVIKRPLLAHVQAAGHPTRANLIMVTSSLPGEGKTFVSVNLAMSLAMELDRTVLLVDADVSRPSVLDRLGLEAAPGLMDVLTDPTLSLPNVLLRTNVPKLSLLPAGRPHGQATELLSSEAMRQLLDELAQRYADRIIVFDAPPLLPSTESRALAAAVGLVVLVVEANKTTQSTLDQTMATLESCPNVLPLLNKIGRSEVGSYHGYYNPVEG